MFITTDQLGVHITGLPYLWEGHMETCTPYYHLQYIRERSTQHLSL